MDQAKNEIDVLIAGESEDFWDRVQVLLKGYYPYNLFWAKNLEELMEPPREDFKPLLSIIEASKDQALTVEWAQVTKMTYSNSPLIMLYNKDTPVDFALVKKNGVDQFMHIPFDEEFISDMVLNLAPCDLEGDSIPLSALLAVNNRDFEPETHIDFDVYLHLPANQKTLKIRKKDTIIDQKALDKATKSTNQRLYVKKTQLEGFYKYSGDVLRQRNQPPVSLTEKSQKIKKEIFSFMGSFLDAGKGSISLGKQINESCQKIFTELGILDDLNESQVFSQIMEHTGQNRSIYNDAINICVFATHFARITEASMPDAAIAGLLHNIGLAKLDEAIVRPNFYQLEPAQQKEYMEHSQFAANMIREKRVPLSPKATKALENQYERKDGSGFPKGLATEDIDLLSGILAIAIRFQELTSIEEGVQSYGATDAIKKMEKDNFDVYLYDTATLTKLRTFFHQMSQKRKAS